MELWSLRLVLLGDFLWWRCSQSYCGKQCSISCFKRSKIHLERALVWWGRATQEEKEGMGHLEEEEEGLKSVNLRREPISDRGCWKGEEVVRDGGTRTVKEIHAPPPTFSKPRGTSVSPVVGGRRIRMLSCDRGCVVVVIVAMSPILPSPFPSSLSSSYTIPWLCSISWLASLTASSPRGCRALRPRYCLSCVYMRRV